MTCIQPDCDQPRLIMPDNIELSTGTMSGEGFVRVDTKPNGRTATPWCREHFPSWLWGTHRTPPTPKPHIRPSQSYGDMADRMAEAIAGAAAAARRIKEPAESLAEAYQEFTEAYGGELP